MDTAKWWTSLKSHLCTQSKNRRDNHQTLTQQEKQCSAQPESNERASYRQRYNVDCADRNVSPDCLQDSETMPRKKNCSYRTRFRDSIKSRLFLNRTSFLFFAFFCLFFFLKRGRVLHNYVSHASLHQRVITILLHRPLYTLHLCTPCTYLVIAMH